MSIKQADRRPCLLLLREKFAIDGNLRGLGNRNVVMNASAFYSTTLYRPCHLHDAFIRIAHGTSRKA